MSRPARSAASKRLWLLTVLSAGVVGTVMVHVHVRLAPEKALMACRFADELDCLRTPARSPTCPADTIARAKFGDRTELPTVFIYEPPPRFYAEPLNCAMSVLGQLNLAGVGLGNVIRPPHLYNTSEFALDVIIYHRLLSYRKRTLNANEADVIIIPYLAGWDLVCAPHGQPGWWTEQAKNRTLSAARAFWEYATTQLPTLPRDPSDAAALRRHFLMAGRIVRDFRYFVYVANPFDSDLNAPGFASLERAERLSQGRRNVYVLPYPTHLHFSLASEPIPVDCDAEKDLLVSSNWRSRTPLRRDLRKQCARHADSCAHYEPADGRWDNAVIAQLNRRSTFCLQPAGDSSTRSAFYEAILLMCIPVVFERSVAFAFPELVDYYKDVVVYIPQQDVLSAPQGRDVVDQLRRVPAHRIREYRAALERVRPVLQFSVLQHDECDAFGLFLRQALQMARWATASPTSARSAPSPSPSSAVGA